MVDEKQRDQERERVFVCSCVLVCGWIYIYLGLLLWLVWHENRINISNWVVWLCGER